MNETIPMIDAGTLLGQYSELYDFASVGYFSLDRYGKIHELNNAGAELLGQERSKLVLGDFNSFLVQHAKVDFKKFLENVFTKENKQTCELELIPIRRPGVYIRAEAIQVEPDHLCRMVAVDITERKIIENTQMFLIKSGWSGAGGDFFQSLARYLAETLQMDYVCIDKLLDKGQAAQTIAVWFDGKYEDNVQYTLKDTPCGDVVGRRICCFPAGVRQLFPGDAVLQEMKAESYVGTTLWDAESNPIGLIAVIGRHPIENPQMADTILNLVAYRAAGEIERMRAEMIRNMIYAISNAVVTTNDLAELIETIRVQLGRIVDTKNFYIAFYDEATGMLSAPHTKDEKDKMDSWPAAKSLTGTVIYGNRPYLLTKTRVLELNRLGEIDLIGATAESWLGVPLRSNGKVIGAFVLQSYDDPNAFSNKDVEFLEFISSQISLSVQRKKSEIELKQALEKAQESDRLKSTFLANMSHEIRTPMNAIVGFSGMISDPDLSEDDRNKYSNIILSRSDDLMHIINDLLEISRIESGNAIVENEKVSLNTLIDEILEVFRQRIKKGKKEHLVIQAEKGLPDNMALINTDGFIIKQVFSNLIDNAIKYTQAGSICFGYHFPSNGSLTCFVTDTGIGITQENQSIIFEHFRQAEIPDSHQYGGTGLGLSICRGSLALLGGEIWVQSECGAGSTFYFKFPYKSENVINIHSELEAIKPKGNGIFNWSGKRILLVEDDKTNMEFLTIILKRTGAELIGIYSGSELRAHYGELNQYDMVLLDVRLPDASGWELAAEIKKQRSDMPVIAQTAYAMESDRKMSEEVGCDAYISKPIKKENLLEVMSRFLQ